MTEKELDRLCGTPTQSFEERLEEDARRMAVRLAWTGDVSE